MRFFALTVLMLSASALCLAQGASKAVVITEKDKWRTVTLAPGDQVDVRLIAQSGTGYSWELLQKGDEKLSFTSETKSKENAMPGAPEEQIFHIVAKSPGTINLVFHYARPWEKTKAPAKIFRLRLRIRK